MLHVFVSTSQLYPAQHRFGEQLSPCVPQVLAAAQTQPSNELQT